MDNTVQENVINVIFARPYSLVDEDTGELKKGISIHYVDNELVNESQEDGIGYPVLKNSIDLEKLPSLTQVPGVYKPIYSKKVSKGQQVVKLVDLQFVAPFNMFPVKEAK